MHRAHVLSSDKRYSARDESPNFRLEPNNGFVRRSTSTGRKSGTSGVPAAPAAAPPPAAAPMPVVPPVAAAAPQYAMQMAPVPPQYYAPPPQPQYYPQKPDDNGANSMVQKEVCGCMSKSGATILMVVLAVACCGGVVIALFTCARGCLKKICKEVTNCFGCKDPMESAGKAAVKTGEAIVTAPVKIAKTILHGIGIGGGGLVGKNTEGVAHAVSASTGTTEFRGKLVPTSTVYSQTIRASVPSQFAVAGYCVMPYALGMLIMLSVLSNQDNELVIEGQRQFCQLLRISIDFKTTAFFDSAIDVHLHACSTDRMQVLQNTYDFGCRNYDGTHRFSDTQLRDSIWKSIEYVRYYNETLHGHTSPTKTDTMITGTECNAITGEGYYLLDGTQINIREICNQIIILSQLTDVPSTSILHDLHDLHIPGCKDNHSLVLSNTFEQNCLPEVPVPV